MNNIVEFNWKTYEFNWMFGAAGLNLLKNDYNIAVVNGATSEGETDKGRGR